MKTAVIYKLEFGEYFYIGSTNNFEKRLVNHLNCLKRKGHYNKFMQRVYNKYGFTGSSILEADIPIEKQYEREQEYIDLYIKHPKCVNGAPLAKGGSGNTRKPVYVNIKNVLTGQEICGNFKLADLSEELGGNRRIS